MLLIKPKHEGKDCKEHFNSNTKQLKIVFTFPNDGL